MIARRSVKASSVSTVRRVTLRVRLSVRTVTENDGMFSLLSIGKSENQRREETMSKK